MDCTGLDKIRLEEIFRSISENEQVGENMFKTFQFLEYSSERNELSENITDIEMRIEDERYTPMDYLKMAAAFPLSLVVQHYSVKYFGNNFISETLIPLTSIAAILWSPLSKYSMKTDYIKELAFCKERLSELNENYNIVDE